MDYVAKAVSVVGFLCVTIGSRGMIRMLTRASHRFGSITTETTAAFRADDGRESFRYSRYRHRTVHRRPLQSDAMESVQLK